MGVTPPAPLSASFKILYFWKIMNPLSEETVSSAPRLDRSSHNETRGDLTRAKVTAGFPAIDTLTRVTPRLSHTRWSPIDGVRPG